VTRYLKKIKLSSWFVILFFVLRNKPCKCLGGYVCNFVSWFLLYRYHLHLCWDKYVDFLPRSVHFGDTSAFRQSLNECYFSLFLPCSYCVVWCSHDLVASFLFIPWLLSFSCVDELICCQLSVVGCDLLLASSVWLLRLLLLFWDDGWANVVDLLWCQLICVCSLICCCASWSHLSVLTYFCDVL